MTHHILRIEKVYYEAKLAGDKLFEIRYNDDRGFQKGDTVRYRVINPERGNSVYDSDGDEDFIITYVTPFKQQDGFVVFGERLME